MKTMTDCCLQQLIFNCIREKIPPNLSLVHEIAELLNISYDSAYRRMRAEKELDLEELRVLVNHYDISLDAFLKNTGGSIVFNSFFIHDGTECLNQWMRSIYEIRSILVKSKDRLGYYCTRDIPVFQYLHFMSVVSFKHYFYNKVQYKKSEFIDAKYVPEIKVEYDFELAREMTMLQNLIPKVEIWSRSTFYKTLDQIKYCYESGFFRNMDDALKILLEYESMCHHIQKQAESGISFSPGTEPEGEPHSYQVYFNEGCFTDNLALLQADQFMTGFIGYNGLNFLSTTNNGFCNYLKVVFNDLMQSSDLISESSAKERNHIFNELYRKIDEVRASLV